MGLELPNAIDDVSKEVELIKSLLKQSEKRLQLLTYHFPTLMVQYSADLLTVEYLNDYFIDWFRSNQNKIVRSGMKCDEMFSTASMDDLRQLIAKSKEQNYQPYKFDRNFPNILRNGKRGVYFTGVLIPLFDDQSSFDKNSSPVAYLSFSRDITNEKQSEIEKEQLKRKAEEDSARQKSEFLVHVSHELRTPLTEILGLMETIFPELQMTEEQQLMAKDAINSGEMLKFLINDLLDLSKIEAGKLEIESLEFEMKQFLEESVPMVSNISKKKNIPIIIHASSAALSSTYYGDVLRLKQLLLNLMTNSLKYSSKGWIGVSVEVADFVQNENQKENCAFVIAVKDQGVGISDDGKKRLFKPFSQAEAGTTRKYGGTGLGLTICEKLASLMHGYVDFDSEYGSGSEFWFYMPFQKKFDADLSPNPPSHTMIQLKCNLEDRIFCDMTNRWSQDLNRLLVDEPKIKEVQLTASTDAENRLQLSYDSENQRKIPLTIPFYTWKLKKFVFESSNSLALIDSPGNQSLITSLYLDLTLPLRKLQGHALCVDDNSINQLIMRKYMTSFGLKVSVLSNGLEALNYYKSNHANIDIILMDCLMPVMDGYEAVMCIRAFEREANIQRPVPIIASTANTLQEDAKKCLDVGMNDYLTKPFQKLKMFDLMEQYLKK